MGFSITSVQSLRKRHVHGEGVPLMMQISACGAQPHLMPLYVGGLDRACLGLVAAATLNLSIGLGHGLHHLFLVHLRVLPVLLVEGGLTEDGLLDSARRLGSTWCSSAVVWLSTGGSTFAAISSS